MKPEAIEWLRTRPVSLHATLIRLPPVCMVRATAPLCCPGPGKTAQVVSYCEPDSDGKIQVSVVGDSNLFSEIRAYCDSKDLEAVSYADGMTPEDVAEALADA